MNRKLSEDWVKTHEAEHLGSVRIATAHFTSERTSPPHVHHEYVFNLILR